MKKMTANFRPAQEPKNGYIGKADITIANAIRLNGISVFRDEDNNINLNFPGFGDGASYVVPKSKEAYADMREVVAMAVDSDNHFGYNKGDYGIHLDVTGKLVEEPYADGRFSVDVADVCVLYGITTNKVEYERDGEHRSFVAVDLPSIGSYEKDGERQYQTAFEGRISSWTRDGVDYKKDYGQLMHGLVIAERKALVRDLKPSLEAQVKEASGKQGESHRPFDKEQEPSLG